MIFISAKIRTFNGVVSNRSTRLKTPLNIVPVETSNE